jgi:ornithine carbamoyltransferase
LASDLRGRGYLREGDFDAAELRSLLLLSRELKQERADGGPVPARLAGRQLAILLEKTSTRTRAAFQVAAQDQGAHVTVFEAGSTQLGHKESVVDTARVLGRMYDAIAFRGSDHTVAEALAVESGIPVYNGLTNEWHPTQSLADFLTMEEHSGKAAQSLAYAFVGDLRFNMGRSLLMMGALMGSDVRLIGPAALAPPDDVQAEARAVAAKTGARLLISEDPAAVEGVDFIHTDVWISMGEPRSAWDERTRLLAPYRVDRGMMDAAANPDVRFMHCLPAFHDTNTVVGAQLIEATGMSEGLEVTDEVFTSSASVVFDQAENRLHTIKALMVATLGRES